MTAFALTYDSLVNAVEQYLERDDDATVNQIPTFIALAEFEIAQQLKTLGQIEVAQGVMQVGNPIIQKPARWRKTVSMSVINATTLQRQPVLLRKYEYATNYNAQSPAGQPLYYSDYDYDNWYVAPVPDEAYQFEVLIYQRLQPLSPSVQTNWITNNAPNAILFGTLLQAALYVTNDARLQLFQQKYEMAMQLLKSEDVARVGDRSAVAIDS